MNIDELATQELELLSQTIELVGTIEEKNDKVVYFGISPKYKKDSPRIFSICKK